MIDKFNFYDIYGYFLPGAAFMAVLWTPFGLVKKIWPSSDLSSALIAAAIAYILGHLLQSIATNAIPSWKVKDQSRYPSNFYLDAEDTELPTPVKDRIAKLMELQFGLNLQTDKKGDAAIDEVRRKAFILARQVLIQGKSVGYAEQFQGMYALTRGLISIFALGFAYWLGWAVSVANNTLFTYAAIILLTLAALILLNISVSRKLAPKKKHVLDRGYAYTLLAAFLTIGYVLGMRYQVTGGNSALLALLAVFSLLASLRAYGAYENFAGLFASTVWLGYLAYNVTPEGGTKPPVQEKIDE